MPNVQHLKAMWLSHCALGNGTSWRAPGSVSKFSTVLLGDLGATMGDSEDECEAQPLEAFEAFGAVRLAQTRANPTVGVASLEDPKKMLMIGAVVFFD